MKIHKICHVLLIIGGLNWLLVGLFSWGVADIVGLTIARIIYVLVGLAAIYDLVNCRNCEGCKTKPGSTTPAA